MKPLLMAIVVGLSFVGQAATWYVSASSGSDSNSGTNESKPFLTIQKAVNAAQEGDSVMVQPGTYSIFSTSNKSIQITSISGTDNTIIDGGGVNVNAHSITLNQNSSGLCTNVVISGFTIQNLGHIYAGTIRGCIIRDNDCSSLGCGICMGSVVENCLMINNGGMNGAVADGCILRSCTLVKNWARAFGVALNSILVNCVVYGNSSNLRGTWTEYFRLDDVIAALGYREKNVYESDPRFVDAANGDYRIADDSPCIDAGYNAALVGDVDLDGNPRIQNGTIDIGAYEYCPKQETVGESTWSYVVKSGKSSICGVDTAEANLVIPETLGGYAIGAIETNAFQSASNVVAVTIPAGVSIGDGALARCANLKTVNFEGLPSTPVVPGFYYAKFENHTNCLDSTASIISNANSIVLAADMLTATNTEQFTTHAYAGYMHFDGNSMYEFLIDYDNWAVIQIDGEAFHSGAYGNGGSTKSITPSFGWHWIDLRGWNHILAGATNNGKNQGVKWRKVGETEWRLFADPGDGSLFRAKMGNLSDVLSGTSVENVTFGESVTAVPDGYFVGVEGLKSLAFADSLVSLGNNDVRFIGVNGGKEGAWVQKDWLFGYIGATPSAVTISDAVQNIAPYAFEGQSGLTRVILSGELTSIGTNAFMGCTGLVSVYAPESSVARVTEMLAASGVTNAVELVKVASVAAPTITPASGMVIGSSQTISMSCSTADAKIYYTKDGTTPTGDSTPYSRFRISGKTTIQAIAILDGVIISEVTRAEYALGRCEDPVISLADGSVFYHSNQEVSISCGEEGILRYTLDGTEPTKDSPIYTGPFTISDSTVVKAKVFSDRYFDSQTVTANLTREWEQVETPIITATAKFTGSKAKVTISCATGGALIRYTTNGNDPNSHSTKYTGPFEVTASCTVKAYAVLSDYTNSEIASFAIEKVWGIGDALNVPDMTFTTSGDAEWVRDTSVSRDGSESMRSGAVTHNQKSMLSGKVTGKGTLTFWWKTSCEQDIELHEWDHVEFIADGVTNILDGVTDWQQVTRTFTTDGEHEFAWRYVKDDVESAGEDCAWVDMLTWTAVPTDPIPVISETATASEVAAALEGSTDPRLTANLTTGAKYNDYRAWADRVAGTGVANRQAIKDSEFAWLSYALDSDKLLTKAPEQGEMRIAAFEKSETTGLFDFSVAIVGVTVGAGATAENLATLLGVEGSPTIDGDFSAKNLSFTFGTPVDGKVTISAEPADATQFFLKVRMTP